MDVLFEHRAKINNKMVIGLSGGKSAVFVKGVYQTTDKNVVKELMSHPFYKRKKFHLKTDKALVSDWLSNDKEPDYLDQEQISTFSVSLINELAEELGLLNKGYPELLKAELIGVPISNQVQSLINKYTTKETPKKTTSRTKVTKLEDKD
jgi:hypothetical protein